MKNEDIIESIVTLLALDGELNKHELRFLNDMCKRLEVPKKVRDRALGRAKQGKGRVHLPEDETDKKRLLYFLMQAVVADGKIDPEERRVLYIVVKNFEMATEDVDDFIHSRLREVKSDLYTTAKDRPLMQCPKCGYKQPKSHKCKRCGIIFKKYKEVQEPTDEDRLMEILASSNIIKQEESS